MVLFSPLGGESERGVGAEPPLVAKYTGKYKKMEKGRKGKGGGREGKGRGREGKGRGWRVHPPPTATRLGRPLPPKYTDPPKGGKEHF